MNHWNASMNCLKNLNIASKINFKIKSVTFCQMKTLSKAEIYITIFIKFRTHDHAHNNTIN